MNAPMSDIAELIGRLIRENPDKARQAFLKPSLAGWFVGQVMKQTDGKADISEVRWDVVSAITRHNIALRSGAS